MPTTREKEILTVAAIRKKRGIETQFLFNERQQIFLLQPSVKFAGETSRLLTESARKKSPVKVVLNPRRAVIEKIDVPSVKEIEEFKRLRILLDKPEKSYRIETSSIDPTVFNVVDRYLKVRCFRLCKRIIPNYKTAKKIFDFCANQSCHLPGPYNISPCIPFQYVIDGCYARAHKMRWIITTKYRYCCEKVFSFANQNFDSLAVRADKWGGCCVTWWYHVAPLVRVRLFKSIVLAMVIDPGMFNKPVLLSTWLSAQENSTCHPNANVSMFSIQPGSAYTPGNYQGTQFTTDPAYALTDAKLIQYENLITCP
jgi:hypothetical protein